MEAVGLSTMKAPHTKHTPLANRALDLVFRMSSISHIQLHRVIAPARLLAYLFQLPTLDTMHCTSIRVMHPWPEDFTSSRVQACSITYHAGHYMEKKAQLAHRLLEHQIKHLVCDGSFTSDLSDFIKARSPLQLCFGLPDTEYLGATSDQASRVGLVGPLDSSFFSSSFHTFCTVAARSPHLVTAHFASVAPESGPGTSGIPAGAFQSLQQLSAPAWLAAKILPGRSVKHLTILALGHPPRFNSGYFITSIPSVVTLTLQAESWEAFCLEKINEYFPSLELIELYLSASADLEVGT